MEKDNQRVALTKHLLKQGLLRLLNEKTMDKINVSELCRVSGINRATFYRHYQTPNNVLTAIELDMVQQMQQELSPPQCRKDLEANFEKVCTYLYDNAELVRVMIRNNSDTDILQLINEFSEKMLREGGYPPFFLGLDSDSIRLMMTCFGGGGYLLLRSWIMEDIQKTPQEITQLLIRFANIGSFIPD